jgi:hypothetical protein
MTRHDKYVSLAKIILLLLAVELGHTQTNLNLNPDFAPLTPLLRECGEGDYQRWSLGFKPYLAKLNLANWYSPNRK